MQRHKGSLAAIAAAHALTVAQGATPVAGAGVSGKLGTNACWRRASGSNQRFAVIFLCSGVSAGDATRQGISSAGWLANR